MLSALGFYPLNPVSCEYELGTPLFKTATLHLENGNTLTIKAENYSEDQYLVDGVKLNGKRVKGTAISHDDIANGGTLVFEMK